MGFERRPARLLIGVGIGVVAAILVLSATGPAGDSEITGNVRRLGGPCLELERWGLLGWRLVGQTGSVTQVTSGDWQPPGSDPSCADVDDSLLLVRMPLDAEPGTYRICGRADDRACLIVDLVPFQATGPGGP